MIFRSFGPLVVVANDAEVMIRRRIRKQHETK